MLGDIVTEAEATLERLAGLRKAKLPTRSPKRSGSGLHGRHTSTDLNEEDFALGEADRLARQLAEAFNKDYERADLAPEVSVHRTIGGR